MWNLDLKRNDMKIEEELFGKRKGTSRKGRGRRADNEGLNVIKLHYTHV
jgi:hypothetical protein